MMQPTPDVASRRPSFREKKTKSSFLRCSTVSDRVTVENMMVVRHLSSCFVGRGGVFVTPHQVQLNNT